jgi:RNA polymerase sigma-70 factor (ECF subfamily)
MTSMRRLQSLSDRDLVEIARLGRLEAYDELVTRFRGAVILVAEQSLNSREAAQDVAQEALLLAFRMLPQLQDAGKFAGWLYAITRHRARRVGARERRSEAADDSRLEHLLTVGRQNTGPGPLETLLKAEADAAVRTVLADLPPELQIVLQLFHCEEWPAARIAEFLSLPLTTVKWRLRSGREQLRRRYIASREETVDVGFRQQERDSAHGAPVAADGRVCGTRRADGELPERCTQLSEAV